MKDYYKILGVSETSSKDEIKKAFRSLAKKYHPDRNGNDENAIKKFQEVNEAYEVLSNEDSKKSYDEKKTNFKNAHKKKNENSKNNKTDNDFSEKTRSKKESMEDLNQYFANFFGFDPTSNNINKDKLKKQDNPIDTSNMFESFFKMKKK
ncbi:MULTISPECIES: J domain-containing protein [Clostridium]|uniref:J domain-containing protein n=1 Tax=Clostridium butyricum TaxID=1492 RepID=A0AAP9RG23_CLOBU|nr:MULTISPECIES: DnaJ domain-containing protein [Clostridium]MDU4853178.1 DnaJ domain-containing protein [Clostridioides difficile]MBO1685210.1 DnaJ domain-containing protein [Clostridium butyricum]MBS4841391.1 DnaJ domain-containing protein [Clostridium sp.]MBZ5746790.1 DnaJ domain-containing protein [Clostridium butyricum]MCQ2018195.1 DnaJ domain-containing protein [Clostridium butyricum]